MLNGAYKQGTGEEVYNQIMTLAELHTKFRNQPPIICSSEAHDYAWAVNYVSKLISEEMISMINYIRKEKLNLTMTKDALEEIIRIIDSNYVREYLKETALIVEKGF